MDILMIGVVLFVIFIAIIIWCRNEIKDNINTRMEKSQKGVVAKILIKEQLKKERKPMSNNKLRAMRITSIIFIISLILALITTFVAGSISLIFWAITIISALILVAIDRLKSFIVRGRD